MPRQQATTIQKLSRLISLDVSSIKELARWWNRVKFSKPVGAQHTALFDIRQSIAELKFYRSQLFVSKTP